MQYRHGVNNPMMTQPANVSVTFPVGQAYEHMNRVLFQPFDISKWFIIGFCAWLAQLGEGGVRSSFNFDPRSGDRSISQNFSRVMEYIHANLHWLVPLGIFVALIALAFWVLFLWINSRGKFMFLHCAYWNRAEVAEPWTQFAREGNSLFGFRLALSLAGMATMLPLLVFAALPVIRMFRAGRTDPGSLMAAVVLFLLFLVISTAFTIAQKLTADFIVPVMFLRRKRCLEAWSELRPWLTDNAGSIIIYLLFQILLAIAIAIIVLVAVVVTCCVAGCLLMIPYLGTVLLLPVELFKRFYSLYFLAQFNGEFQPQNG